MTVGLATGLALLGLALVARGASVNRHVRVRLLVSAFALALYVLSDAELDHQLEPELAPLQRGLARTGAEQLATDTKPRRRIATRELEL